PTGPSSIAPSASTEPLAKALPANFHRVASSGVSNTGWPLQIVCDRDGATMVLVPGGNYRMGRDDGELSEGPGHRVVLGTYYIDQHEVTVRQFDVFQKQDGNRSERTRALLKVQSSANDSDDAPVTMVNAREAKDYATWSGKQLPTEAQWEIAARSGDGRLFPWGNEDAQWDKPREFRKVQPVRSHARDVSPFGAFDMAGNAWEWTKDWYDIKYYSQFRSSVADNPTGPAKPKSEQLTVRGCSKNWSITKREGLKWNTRLPHLGFRCVLQVEGPGNAFEAPAASGGPAAPGGGGNPAAVVPF
ncbi:MAG: SUMF1/EgtB/PvdO family nonheme iron enzyme, partial [Isosphaeraceae bacterium]|nr:SUMF1/EgtB/PvdO family nonheme iron enzyme [Isosphaeraceae bacterium]